MEFSRISAPSLKELFVKQIQNKILEGRLPVGSRLPSERELAQQMQVSRAVVNGGLAELAQRGFLEIQPRQGVFVADYRRHGNINTLLALMEYNGGVLADSEIRAILEVRRALEHTACELAIENASDKILSEIAEIIDDLGRATTPSEAAEIAFRFQTELAIAGGNSIIRMIYASFKSPVIVLWERFCAHYSIEQLYRNSARLFDYVRSRDKAGVNAYIDEYLNDSINGRRQIYNG